MWGSQNETYSICFRVDKGVPYFGKQDLHMRDFRV